MRNLFLLFTCIILALFLKTVNEDRNKREKLISITIEKSHVIEFNGTVFLPQTINVREGEVKQNSVTLTISGKNFLYAPKFGDGILWLQKEEAKELEIEKGDKIETTGTVSLFFSRELE